MGTSFIFTCIPSCYDFGSGLYFYSLCTRFVKCVTQFQRIQSILSFFVILFCVIFFSAGQATLFVYLNCFVHAVMYTYYLLSIYKPLGITPSVTMKKSITCLQTVSINFLYVCVLLCSSEGTSLIFYSNQIIFFFGRFNHTLWSYILDMDS